MRVALESVNCWPKGMRPSLTDLAAAATLLPSSTPLVLAASFCFLAAGNAALLVGGRADGG